MVVVVVMVLVLVLLEEDDRAIFTAGMTIVPSQLGRARSWWREVEHISQRALEKKEWMPDVPTSAREIILGQSKLSHTTSCSFAFLEASAVYGFVHFSFTYPKSTPLAEEICTSHSSLEPGY